jgi:monovalent cation:H+ antiporter-2, CPA2 family
MHNSIIFDLGIVLIIGFLTASFMKKIGLSVIIGYMVSGLLIGPYGLKLISQTTTIEQLSELGVVFLMFFLGLEFSINKFKRIKNSVFFIGTYEVIFNLLLGFSVGLLLGMTFIQNLFMSCIIALSSSGVVAKLLFEMKKTASYEAEILMGVMVFEDFFAIVLLGVLSSISITKSIQLGSIFKALSTAAIFYIFMILLGVFVINKFIDYLTKIESQELFTALMLGVILLVGWAAASLGLASAAGAFLLGMIIVSYDVEERVHRTVSSFKDIFLIVFFISFGTLLNPAKIPAILLMILIAVPISVLGEILITSSAAYFCGFNGKRSLSIGSSMIARGEYSLIFASVGLTSGAISETLYQFTGVYVFIMTLIAPVAIKNSEAILGLFNSLVPNIILEKSQMISTSLKPILMPDKKEDKHNYTFLILFYSYLFLSAVVYMLNLNLVLKLILSSACLLLTFILRYYVDKEINKYNSNKSIGNLFYIILLFIILLPYLTLLF